MNHTENSIQPDYLEAKQLRLLDWTAIIQAAGKVAPAYCWLIESSEEKGSRTYTCIKLITQRPDERLTSKSLGRPGSDRHDQWKTAIARREAIALHYLLTLNASTIFRGSKADSRRSLTDCGENL